HEQVRMRRVEPSVLEGKVFGGGLLPPPPPCPAASRLIEHLRGRVDTPYPRPQPPGREHREPAGAAAPVQQPRGRPQLGQLHRGQLPPALAGRPQLVVPAGQRCEVHQPAGAAASTGVCSSSPRISRGAPRSASGTSIPSKSRGTTVWSNTVRASRRICPPV